jgi:NDP-sugar pyrophosphorylase family protein
MKAMILAAGFGTRLFPLTVDRTKPALPFLGKPLVGFVAEYLAGFGIRDIVVNLHHQPESVRRALGDGSSFGVKISYVEEFPEILGTAGAIENARRLIGDETFLVINGKVITDIDLEQAFDTHQKAGAAATMVLRENRKRERFSEVKVSRGEVIGFGNFLEPRAADSEISECPLMFTGIQILEPEVFDYIPHAAYSDIIPIFYLPAIRENRKIAAHVARGRWFELSTIRRYLDISLAMMGERKFVCGANCSVRPGANVENSILWDNVLVGENARLDSVVAADNVQINPGQEFKDVAIVPWDLIADFGETPPKAPKGKRIGDNYVVPID